MDDTNAYSYQPGACNIGKMEVRRRFRNGYIGFGFMLFVILVIEYFNLPFIFKFLAFPPAFYGVSGFVQAFSKFCYVFGLKGVTSLTGRRIFKRVTEDVYVRQDYKRAMLLITTSTIGGLALTAIYFWLFA